MGKGRVRVNPSPGLLGIGDRGWLVALHARRPKGLGGFDLRRMQTVHLYSVYIRRIQTAYIRRIYGVFTAYIYSVYLRHIW